MMPFFVLCKLHDFVDKSKTLKTPQSIMKEGFRPTLVYRAQQARSPLSTLVKCFGRNFFAKCWHGSSFPMIITVQKAAGKTWHLVSDGQYSENCGTAMHEVEGLKHEQMSYHLIS
jgi:hypothetical protein